MRNDQLNSVDTTDVIVVGGGVIGLAVARALSERGAHQVTVVESAEPGKEASHAAGGMLAAQAEANQDDALFELCLSSRELYPAWATSLLEETGIDIQLEQTGTLYLAFTDEDEEELERRSHWQTEAGLRVDRLTSEEARALEPNISSDVRGVLRFPLDVQVDNRRLIVALISSLEKRRVYIRTGTKVNTLCIEHNQVTGVETDFGMIRANTVVVANGAWASLLLDSDSRLPSVRIEPVRGQMLCLRPTIAMRHVLYSPRGYIIPRLSGQILVGSTSEHVGFEKDVTREGVHTIMTNGIEIAPEVVRNASLVDSWSGLRPRAEDGLPIIGACADIEGLFLATGHYRNGILLAPQTGKLIAAEINGIAPTSLNAFSPNRFQSVAVD